MPTRIGTNDIRYLELNANIKSFVNLDFVSRILIIRYDRNQSNL